MGFHDHILINGGQACTVTEDKIIAPITDRITVVISVEGGGLVVRSSEAFQFDEPRNSEEFVRDLTAVAAITDSLRDLIAMADGKAPKPRLHRKSVSMPPRGSPS
jgi:hypothetical protein